MGFVLRAGRGGSLGSADGCRVGGDDFSDGACIVRCAIVGTALLGAPDGGVGRAADTFFSVPLAELSWLVRWTLGLLSRAGFLGTGGTGLRDIADEVDTRLEARDLVLLGDACVAVESGVVFGSGGWLDWKGDGDWRGRPLAEVAR